MKRSSVRTRTLGVGWEERFLEAVRKARERKLVAPEQAEKLRAFAGVYFCASCRKEHRTESRLGKEHLRLQPREAPAPVEAAAQAKAKGARARARLLAPTAPGGKPKVQRTLDGAPAKEVPPKARRAARARGT